MPFDKSALKSSDLHECKTIEVPEWKQSVAIRTLTSGDRFKIEKLYMKGLENAERSPAVKLISLCLVDPDSGELLFKNEEDLKLLEAQPAKVIDMLFKEASEMNALSKTKVEEVAKNSEATSKDDSSSA